MKGILRAFLTLTPLLGALARSPPVLQTRQSTTDQSSKYVLPVGSRECNSCPAYLWRLRLILPSKADFYNGQSKASVTFDQHSVLLDGKAR
jgi:hypothetical protein